MQENYIVAPENSEGLALLKSDKKSCSWKCIDVESVAYQPFFRVYEPFGIKFFNAIKSVLSQLGILRGWTAAFVLIGRDVHSMAFKVAQAVSCHQDVRSSLLNQFDASVIRSRTLFALMPGVSAKSSVLSSNYEYRVMTVLHCLKLLTDIPEAP